MPDRPVDPTASRDSNAFDRPTGYSGQDDGRDHAAAEGRRAAGARDGAPDVALPPDNGRRASIDAATGEVHGAGVGAGGGQPGEDFDSDAASGDGYPLTGGEHGDRGPGDLGPPHVGV